MPSITQTLATETIAERLRETMKTQGITSVQLARMAGIKTSFLYDVLRRKSHNPSIIRLARVAEALEVPLTYLVGKDQPPLPAHAPYPAQKMVMVPYITTENQKIITAPSAFPPLCFHAGWLQEHFSNPACFRLWMVEDDAMQPVLQPGDSVLVDTASTAPTASGIFIVRVKDTLHARRLAYLPGVSEKIILRCDNPAYVPETRPLAGVEIGGRVIWASRFI